MSNKPKVPTRKWTKIAGHLEYSELDTRLPIGRPVPNRFSQLPWLRLASVKFGNSINTGKLEVTFTGRADMPALFDSLKEAMAYAEATAQLTNPS